MSDHDFAVDEPLITQSSSTTLQVQETTDPPVHHAPAAFIWALTIAASISGLLFGYELVTTQVLGEITDDTHQHWCHLLYSRFSRIGSVSAAPYNL